MRVVKFFVCLLAFSFSLLAFADEVPVEDMSQTAQSSLVPVTQDTGNSELRTARIEQQMQNFTQMNLPGQIEALREQVQRLQGQLDVQTHDLQTLRQQLDNYYQDLNQRLKKQQSRAQLVTAIPEQADNSAATANSANGLFDSGKDLQAYKAGFNLLMQHKYDDAAAKLQDYLNNYPTGQYVANAHYWLGEIFYMQMHYEKSAAQFNTIAAKYPNSGKVADAIYKLAIIDLVRGNTDQAKLKLTQVSKKYPQSSAARLAEQQLAKLNQL